MCQEVWCGTNRIYKVKKLSRNFGIHVSRIMVWNILYKVKKLFTSENEGYKCQESWCGKSCFQSEVFLSRK